MKTKDLELELKKISPHFEIVPNKNSPDIAGLYWKGYCAYIAMPNPEIFPTRNEGFTDAYGNVHRGADQVIDMAKNFLNRIENDAEYKDLITTNDAREEVKIVNLKPRDEKEN